LCSCVCDMDHGSATKYHYYYNYYNLLLQRPSLSQQATSRVQLVMSTFSCEVTQDVSGMWVFCPTLLQSSPCHCGLREKGSVSLLWLTFSRHLASLLLRWKTANTAFVVLSLTSSSEGIHVRLPCLCLEHLPLFVSLHQRA